MERQLVLKQIMTLEEYNEIKEDIRYDFMEDNHFTELKEMEIQTERVNVINNIDPYMGRYFSQRWAKKNVLRMTDEEIEQMDAEIEDEQEEGDIHPELEPAGPPVQQPEEEPPAPPRAPPAPEEL